MNICLFYQCGRAVQAWGLCAAHYKQRWKRKPLTPIRTAGVIPCSECGQDTRPYGATAKDWPNTVARGSTSPLLCMTHRQAVTRGHILPRTAARQKATPDRTVRRPPRAYVEGEGDWALSSD